MLQVSPCADSADHYLIFNKMLLDAVSNLIIIDFFRLSCRTTQRKSGCIKLNNLAGQLIPVFLKIIAQKKKNHSNLVDLYCNPLSKVKGFMKPLTHKPHHTVSRSESMGCTLTKF